MDVLDRLEEGFEVDCVYLDLNGALHVYSHDNKVNNNPSLEEIFAGTEKFIRGVAQKTSPTTSMYLVLDGVAPRAKMNQQRARRFTSMKEKRQLHQQLSKSKALWERLGLSTPDEISTGWDSNQITPGTSFMEQANEFFHEFAARYVQENPSFQVVVSDSSVVGEGEHKIMDFLRTADKDLRHCVVGNDSDLYLLCSVLPLENLFILRQFQCGKKSWNIIDVQKLRLQIFEKMGGKIDEENSDELLKRFLLDFVYLSSFYGNDFLPSLPSMQLHNNSKAISQICQAYINMREERNEFIANGREVNYEALAHVLRTLEEQEADLLKKSYRFFKSRAEQSEENSHGRGQRRGGMRRRDRKKRRKDERRKRASASNSPEKRSQSSGSEENVSKGSASPESRQEGISTPPAKEQQAEIELPPPRPPHRLDPLIRQLEYYLSDRNLTRDKFMGGVMEANDGVKVPSFLFLEFDMVKNLKASLDDIRTAAEVSETLQIDDDDYVSRADGFNICNFEARAPALDFSQQVDFVSRRVGQIKWADSVPPVRWGDDGWIPLYHEKMTKLNEDEVVEMSTKFLEGMAWVLDYYLHGICDWRWFYPYHYAPTMNDIYNIIVNQKEQFEFENTTPVKPSLQLLSVLPASSKKFLPECFHHVFSHPALLQYYPDDVKHDYSGCVKGFQGKALIPFLDVELLEQIVNDTNDTRSAEQKKRDVVGPDLLYVADPDLTVTNLSQQGVDWMKYIRLGVGVAGILGVVWYLRSSIKAKP